MSGGKLSGVLLRYDSHKDASRPGCRNGVYLQFANAAQLEEYIPQLEYVLSEMRRCQETFEEQDG